MIYPPCVCGKPRSRHELIDGSYPGRCVKSDCVGYSPRPRVSVRRSAPVARTSKPRKKRKGKRASIARECDRLWSLIVRSRGKCEITRKRKHLQGAHGFSRRYRATRWLTINGFCLSAGAHVAMTYHPLAWDEYIRHAWGVPVYDELRRLALENKKQDMPAVLAKLRAEAAARGIK